MTEFRDRHRIATVVLVDRRGQILGQLPPLKLEIPWLQEVGDLVAGVKRRDDLDITVLRLLETDDTTPPAIAVSYLGQADDQATSRMLIPWPGSLDDHPLRLPYARPGGPARDLAWAEQQLLGKQLGRVARSQQVRTWNLSSIWRLETASDTYWLKCVPPFFAHEGRMLQLLHRERVPRLIAAEEHRVLLAHLDGEDCVDADVAQILSMVDALVDLQWRWHDGIPALLEAGASDYRYRDLESTLSRVIGQHIEEMTTAERRVLEAFVQDLPARLRAIDACSLPETLVHGDYHPGNWRGDGLDLTIMDWGDCCVGHPLLDLPALLARAGDHRGAVLSHWCSAWQSKLPEADVTAAAKLILPVASARLAAVYQGFLDHIEPSEHVYHESDPVSCLRRTVATLS